MLGRLGFAFTATNGESSFSFAIGSQASISANGAAERTTLTIDDGLLRLFGALTAGAPTPPR